MTSDAFIINTVRDNFEFITGAAMPKSKGKQKGAKEGEGASKAEWFREMSPIHFCIFHKLFVEGKERGLFNAFEIGACEEVIAIISKEK